MTRLSFADLGAGWADALGAAAADVELLEGFLESETELGHGFLPDAAHVLRAFRTPLADTRVLIVGQDPYPTPGHAIGLSFAVDALVHPLPRSLANIYRELHDDLGIAPASHGDLSSWQGQGVMLLNRVLTVQPGVSGSHRGRGWERVTELAIRALVQRGSPLVAVLWGKDAHSVVPALGSTPVIASAHPSPLSASRGFFGSRPFSRVNAELAALGAAAVDWRVR